MLQRLIVEGFNRSDLDCLVLEVQYHDSNFHGILLVKWFFNQRSPPFGLGPMPYSAAALVHSSQYYIVLTAVN